MPPALQTARLSFRDFTVDDYDSVHAYGSDPEVTRYTAFGPNTPEQTKGFHSQRLARPADLRDAPGRVGAAGGVSVAQSP